MPIDIYSMRLSSPCRAVLMTGRQLNIVLNVKTVNTAEAQHFSPQFLKMNPAHTVPTMDDNGFYLWESRAIMQYLCNQYSPDSHLYPSHPKHRALVDRWLYFDMSLHHVIRQCLFSKLITGLDASNNDVDAMKNQLKLLNNLIGTHNKYLVGDGLTLADLSVLATTVFVDKFDVDVSDCPNFKRWYDGLSSQLPYFDEINNYDMKSEVEGYDYNLYQANVNAKLAENLN